MAGESSPDNVVVSKVILPDKTSLKNCSLGLDNRVCDEIELFMKKCGLEGRVADYELHLKWPGEDVISLEPDRVVEYYLHPVPGRSVDCTIFIVNNNPPGLVDMGVNIVGATATVLSSPEVLQEAVIIPRVVLPDNRHLQHYSISLDNSVQDEIELFILKYDLKGKPEDYELQLTTMQGNRISLEPNRVLEHYVDHIIAKDNPNCSFRLVAVNSKGRQM